MPIRQYHIGLHAIMKDHIGENEIYWRTTLAQVEAKSGLAADATGVKASSPKAKVSSRHLKKLVVRASISAIPTDATVRVEVYNATTGSVIGYVEFAGATGESEAEVTTGWSDGDLIQLRVNVTTASATAGATFDLDYAILEAEYGVS